MNLILLGAPGSGKGTLAKKLCTMYKIPQISSGDILRANIAFGTILGNKAKEYMNKGELVPDEIMLDLLKQRLAEKDCEKGFILDGYPRSILQAEELKKFVSIDCVIQIDLPFDIIEQRLTSRMICDKCGEIYDTSVYKKTACDKCGGPLFQRDDDKLETIRNRLEVYERQTAPLINFYGDVLHKINSLASPEKTFEAAKNILDNLEVKVDQ